MNHMAIKRGLAVIAVTGAITAAFIGGKVWAAGVPATGALTYSGNLENSDGTPLVGSQNVQIQFWNAVSGGSVPLCQTAAQQIALEAQGRFTIALPDSCTAAVRANVDVWVETIANGTSLGRSKLGAVPYALEAAAASQGAQRIVSGISTPAKVCSGVTSPTGTSWTAYDNSTVQTTVDISKCGFTAIPVVTSALGAVGTFVEASGGSQPHDISNLTFTIYVRGTKALKPADATANQWNVNWIAVGN